jgi:rhamnosyltransferase
MTNKKKCSIIIRTHNEERWIEQCLKSIFNQRYKNFEIIIVDNKSTDNTLKILKKYKIKKIININNYLPGKSLNLGINQSRGEYIVCISAHCIPTNNLWLSNLVSAIESDGSLAGVYGRQQPMSFTSPSDKRDLMIVFGLDKKIQKKDSFFHNANSIIKRECWEIKQFDNETTNIEDRIWAQEMINLKKFVYYEPEASVYHFHGIHQNNNNVRLSNIVKIVEDRYEGFTSGKLEPTEKKICAIIPLRGTTNIINMISLLSFTINSIKKSKFIDEIIISTDNKSTAKLAKSLGAKVPFLRDKKYSNEDVSIEEVYSHTLEKLEQKEILFDIYFFLEETFPFRENDFIDSMISKFLLDGYDSMVASKEEPSWIWKRNEIDNLERIDEGDIPRKFKNNFSIALHGLGLVTYPDLIRNKRLFKGKTGFFDVKNSLSYVEVRSKESYKNLLPILKKFSKNEK